MASDDLRARIDAAIRQTLLFGLQDAELHDEPGRERIGEWADWISKTLAELVQPELVQRDVALARLASARALHQPEPFEAIIADQDERIGDVCSVCQELWPCPTVQALDDPPRGLSAPYCGAYMTEWVCVLPSGRHPGWRHVDGDGNWWDQTRCPNDCGEPAYRHAANGCPEGPEPDEPAPTLGYDLPDGFRAGPGGEQ